MPTITPAPASVRSNAKHADRVAIIGGGTAGAHAAATLQRSSRAKVTIVEPTGHHQFLTRLAGVAGGTAPASDAARPLAEMFPTVAVEHQRANRIDEHETSVDVHLTNDTVLTVDAVIVTAGAEPVLPSIRGVANARPLRSATDALAIREAVASNDRLVVIGAGATGCQLAATAAVAHPDLDITIVDRADRLLPGFRRTLGHHTARILADRGVDTRLGEHVSTISRRGTRLAESGEQLEGLVVWAGGYRAAGEAFGLGPTIEGRLVIDAFGRVAGSSRVFAAGDVAAHTDRREHLRPMSAQIAAQAGKAVARNVAAILGETPLERVTLTDLGWVVDLGGGQGVAEVLGVPLADRFTDRLVPVLHTAIDYRNLWQLGGVSFMRTFGPGTAAAPTADQLANDLAAFDLGLD